MAAYDYRCPVCGFMDEVRHGMHEKPQYECPECGELMRRVFTVPNLGHGHGRVLGMLADRSERTADMRQELNEDYGIENVAPIRAGSLSEVYNDVKMQGGFVREKMQENAESANAKRLAKQKEWKQKAIRRAPKRSQEIVARKSSAEQAKRLIRI